MDEFLLELLSDYKTEAAEHIQTIQNGLIQLENESDEAIRKELIEVIYRETHSLKGASRVVNQSETEKICMSLESQFSLLKRAPIGLNHDFYTLYNKTSDLLAAFITSIGVPENKPPVNALQQTLRNLDLSLESLQVQIIKNSSQTIETVKGVALEPDSDALTKVEPEIDQLATKTKNIDNETIRINVEKLNSILLQSEEFVTAKNSFEYFAKELQKLNNSFADYKRNLQNKTSNSNNEFNQTKRNNSSESLKKFDEDFSSLSKQFQLFRHSFERQINDLQTDIKKTLVIEFRNLFVSAPKLVRDLCVQSGKQVEVQITGDDIEIDRRILEDMKDPVMHLLRNCVDHGIELPSQRGLIGKPEKGCIKIQIQILPDKKIEVSISDDGVGINTKKIVEKALKSNLISAQEANELNEKQKLKLIFSSGLSSSEIITDISGRGLGMSIVEEKVIKNGGTVDVYSELNKGTTFKIILPQTLNVYRGVLIKSAGSYFTIPVGFIEKVIRVNISDIRTVESRKCIFYGDKSVAVHELSDLIGISGSKQQNFKSQNLHMMILKFASKFLAIIVDKVKGEFEGILKDMGPQLRHVHKISGVTMLGNGKLVCVLNVAELIEHSNFHISNTDINYPDSDKPEIQKRILIAEDSITIRSMLRSYVENAGYYVKLAVDGLHAYQLLQQEQFDLVVSDVEMPRMNGFELTAKIRENAGYSDMPVILVTALESTDDKQRGLEAGANAYIIKSSFEQSNLLDTIKRLV